jgi:putative serine protease PepD
MTKDPRCSSIDVMLKPTAAASTVLAVAALLGFAACGGDDESNAASPAAVRAPASAMALQNQFVKVVDAVSPEVVQVQCGRSLGSGIVFDSRGDVVTNAHVVAGAEDCAVTLSGGDEHPAKVVGRDSGNDLAVVRLSDATPEPAAFADSSKVDVGEMVLAMGNPLGLRSSVTQGIVSSLDRSVAESSTVELSQLIQTSAEINPGNSGGALVDLSGRVIGIPTLTAVDPEFGDTQAPGIGFAIPSNTVRRVANGLIGSG